MAREVHGTLLLLRRGPLTRKWDQTVIGQSDPPLSRGAVAEEKRVVKAVAAIGPSRVVASDLRRARGTAERIAVASDASFGIRRDLREQRLGRWQGRTWADVVRTEEAEAVAFLHDFCRSEPPGGEALTTVVRRITKALLSELRRHQRKTVVYVGHAGPIRCILSYALQLPLEAVQRFQLDPFGLSAIRFQGDASAVTLLNHPAAGGIPGGLPS